MSSSAIDEGLHTPSENPRWNESGWFGFHVPERTITGFIYMHHRQNMNYTLGGLALWDPSGEQMWDCLFHDWHDTMPLTGDAKMFDYTADNSLTLKTIEPLKRYRITYNAEGCELDLTWTARIEPFLSGLPEGMEDWAKDTAAGGHFEQAGRMTGSFKLESMGWEQVQVDCLSVRDRSWGPRIVTPDTPRGANPWAAAENTSFFINAFGENAEPLDGTTERVVSGHFWADGEVGNLTSGTYRTVERDAEGRPHRVEIDAVDSLGRPLRAEGHAVNHLWWVGYPHNFVYWSLAEWTINGEPAWGNVIEWYPTRVVRRHQRALHAPAHA